MRLTQNNMKIGNKILDGMFHNQKGNKKQWRNQYGNKLVKAPIFYIHYKSNVQQR